LQDVISRLREQRDDNHDAYAREILELEQSQALRWMLENIHPDMVPSVLEGETGAERIAKVPRLTAARIAAMIGISRRSFYRWYPGWRRIVFEGVAKVQPRDAILSGEAVTDYDPHEHAQSVDAALGWREPDAAAKSA
jgi:hypothetical protein